MCHLCISFGELSIQIFGSFLNQVLVFLLLSFKNSLYILDISPLSGVFYKYFLVCSLSFHSLNVFCRGVFTFNEVLLTNFAPLGHAFGILSK